MRLALLCAVALATGAVASGVGWRRPLIKNVTENVTLVEAVPTADEVEAETASASSTLDAEVANATSWTDRLFGAWAALTTPIWIFGTPPPSASPSASSNGTVPPLPFEKPSCDWALADVDDAWNLGYEAGAKAGARASCPALYEAREIALPQTILWTTWACLAAFLTERLLELARTYRRVRRAQQDVPVPPRCDWPSAADSVAQDTQDTEATEDTQEAPLEEGEAEQGDEAPDASSGDANVDQSAAETHPQFQQSDDVSVGGAPEDTDAKTQDDEDTDTEETEVDQEEEDEDDDEDDEDDNAEDKDEDEDSDDEDEDDTTHVAAAAVVPPLRIPLPGTTTAPAQQGVKRLVPPPYRGRSEKRRRDN